MNTGFLDAVSKKQVTDFVLTSKYFTDKKQEMSSGNFFKSFNSKIEIFSLQSSYGEKYFEVAINFRKTNVFPDGEKTVSQEKEKLYLHPFKACIYKSTITMESEDELQWFTLIAKANGDKLIAGKTYFEALASYEDPDFKQKFNTLENEQKRLADELLKTSQKLSEFNKSKFNRVALIECLTKGQK